MDKDVEDAIKKILAADEETIEYMEPIGQMVARDIREMADGKRDNFRIIDRLWGTDRD